MNYVPLIDSNDDEYTTRVMNIMKAFNLPLDYSSTNLPDLVDVQSIMKEGKVQDLAKCIQNVLNYNLNPSTNNSVRILDPSFVTLFHLAQFIIKFLLFWKANLFNENIKLQNQSQELEKLRKDLQLKRLEARDLRKQLSINLRSKNAVVSECSQCQKIFVNDAYLFAHHKRRHENQPFVSSGNDIQFLQNEMYNLKQQLIDVQESSPSRFMKMKIVPEMGCLASQEKYWKGKMRELHDNFEEDKGRLEKIINDLKTENARLYDKLNPETKSIQIQTESSNFVINSKYFKPLEVQQCSSSNLLNGDFNINSLISESTCGAPFSSAFRRWSLDTRNKPLLSSPRKDTDDKVDSFLVGHNRRKSIQDEKRTDHEASRTLPNERREEVRKVIAKLFTTDESSEELAEKLIRIYDKRGSLVKETSCESNSGNEATVSMLVKTTESEASEEGPVATSVANSEIEANLRFDCENTSFVESDESVTAETTGNSFLVKTIAPISKRKSRFFPFLKNIPTKIMKNYIKSRKVRTEVAKDEITNPSSNQSNESPTEVETDCIEISSETHKNESAESELALKSNEIAENKSSEVKLVSVLKKSKSTGNLVKKVMFTDEQPTIRTYSESELPRSNVFESRSITNTIVTTVDVHHDKFAIPVPAPRARKNIGSSVNGHS